MKFLKRNNVPWMTKGRWYSFFIESNGTTAVLTKKDVEEATLASGRLNLPHDLNIVETLFDVHNVEFESGTANVGHTQTFTASGATYLTLPAAKAYDYMWIHIYAIRR